MFPGILISILIGVLIIAAILYVISLIPSSPENAWLIQIARVIVIVFAIIWLVYLLYGAMPIGSPYPYHR
jgi:uncharacterized BrkB/YihY/UPF0761 family membrane protein